MPSSNIDALKEQVQRRIDELMPDLTALSDDIFAHPEVRYEEYHAAEAIAALLRGQGMDVETGTAGLPTAFVARTPGHQSGPRVGILAEYDALPGMGHACGHNLIGTAAVGAFLALSSLAGELDGSVTLLGTPAEEGGAGKIVMLEHDAFDGLDAVMMTHPTQGETIVDYPFLAAGSVALQFHGKAAHPTSSPTEGINALDPMILTFNGANGLRLRLPKDVNLACIITHGGQAVNIIPDFAEIVYRVRADRWQTVEWAMNQLIQLAEGCATACGARLTALTRYGHRAEFPFYMEDRQNEALKSIFRGNMDRVDIPHGDWTPDMGRASTDFANVSQEIPGMHLMLHLDGSDGNPPHTPPFAVASGSEHGHSWIRQAAAIMALSTIDILNAEGALDDVRRAHALADG